MDAMLAELEVAIEHLAKAIVLCQETKLNPFAIASAIEWAESAAVTVRAMIHHTERQTREPKA